MANIGHNSTNINVTSLTDIEKKRVKNTISELNDSMTRVAAEKELQKESINKLNEELGLDKRLIRRIAKAYFRSNFTEEKDADNVFHNSYLEIMNFKINV